MMHCKSECDPEVRGHRPAFENIDFTYAKDAKPGVAAMMLGCDEAVKQGLIINNAKELILKNVNITGCEGEPVVTGNVDKIIK